MSEGDDTRVLNMRINNKQFLSGASDSLKAIDTLNKGIDGAGKGKGMQNLGGAVDQVKGHFKAMEVVGVTALATITNKAVNAGLNLVKSFTIAPIMDGFHEYQKILTSTQTILANTGKPIKQVNAALDELNHYSDATIYNFGQMADNIGRFTAAGVKLGPAVSAIKGLSNAAALSGSSAEQLNSAMYQVSQALSSGTIKLMDWNSLVNANLGGKNIQNALKLTAQSSKDNGAAMDAAIKKYGNFRDSLTSGWLNAGIFTKAMKVFAGQTLDASTSTEKLTKLGLTPAAIAQVRLGHTIAYSVKQLEKMGYSKKAAEQLSKLSQASIDSATKIKTFSQLLDVVKEAIGSGWSGIFRELFGDLKESGDLWTNVGNKVNDAISQIFGGIIEMLHAWHNASTMIDGKKLNGFTLAWMALGNIVKSIGNIFHPIVVLFQSLVPSADDGGNALFGLTLGFYKFSVMLENVTSNMKFLNPLFVGLGVVLKFAFGLVGVYVKSMVDLIMLFKPVGVAVVGLVQALGNLADRLLGTIGITANLGKAFSSFENIRAAILMPFINTLADVINSLTALANGDISFDQFKKNFVSAFAGLGGSIIDGIAYGLSNIGSITSAIGGLVSRMLNFFKGLLGIHSPSTVFAEFGKNIVEGLANGLLGALSLIGKAIKGIGDKLLNADEFDIANMLSIIFGGAVFLTVTKFIRSLLGSFNDIHALFQNFNGLLSQTTSNLKAVQRGVQAKALLNVAIAIGVLAASLWVLSKIPYDRLAVGVPVIIVLLKSLSAVMTSMAKNAATTKTAVASMVAMSLAMTLMATAILILSAAILAFGKMDTGTLVKGMLVVGIVMAALVVAAQGLSKAAPSMILAAAGLLILSVALDAMSATILLFSLIKPETLIKGLAKMAATLIVLGLAMSGFADFAPAMLIASAALIVLGIALTGLAGVIAIFSKISFGTVISSTAKMAIAIVALGLAGEVAAPGLIVLGIAAAAIGAGLFLAGAGVALLGAGLTVLAAAGVASAAVLAASFESFLSILPLMAVQIVAALDAFLAAIAKKMPSIVDSLVKIGAEVLRGLGELSGKIVDVAVQIIEDLLQGLIKVAPKLGDAAGQLIEGLLQGLNDNTSGMIDAGVDLIVALITGVANAAGDLVTAAGEAILSFLTALDTAITTYEPQIIAMGIKIAFDLIQGLVQGIVPQPILDAFTGFVKRIVNFFKGLLGINSPSTVFAGFGRNIVEGLANGIGAAVGLVTGAISNLVSGAIGIVKALPGKARAALSGLGGILKSVFSGAFNAAKGAVTTGVNAIGTAVRSIPGMIRGAISAVGGAAKALGSAIIHGIGQGISSIGNFAANIGASIKTAVNNALGLPKHIGFNVDKGPIHIHAGVTIPKFARGVTGFGGGTALVGEKGPEMVSMGRGSNVITNENLVAFMKQVAALTRVMTSNASAKNSPGGSIQYVVSADFQGDPRGSGVEFAANIAAGLINGLKANQPGVNSTMSGVATNMSDSFTKVLGIQSPSTVFKKYASYVGQGFINGLVASTDGVAKAAKAMGEAAITAIAETVTDGQIKLEALRAKTNAYSDAAAVVRAKAAKTKNKADKKRLEAQAAALEKQAKAQQKISDAQAKSVDAQNAATERKEAFANADTQGKADMKKEDAVKEAQAASRARENSIRLSKEADLVRKYDKKRAALLDKQAKEQLAKSKVYADEANAYAKESYDLTVKAKAEEGAADAADQAAQIQSVTTAQVEAAQAAFNSYAKSLADAEQSAKKDLPPTEVKFEQNNYSPEAISAADAYRNGKSLTAIIERKLQPTP